MIRAAALPALMVVVALSGCARSSAVGTSGAPATSSATGPFVTSEADMMAAALREEWDTVFRAAIGPAREGDNNALYWIGYSINDGFVTAANFIEGCLALADHAATSQDP